LPSVLAVLCATALFAASSARAQTPIPPSARKISVASRTLPLTKFYDTPDPLPAGKPGELIRFETSEDYHLSYETSAFRILYHSRSSDGKDVAVSGVVLLPVGTPPAGGWPVIAWAHDFAGFARQCAPSLLKNLNAGPLLSMYVGQGYAIVVSDYAGLGTDFSHAALDARSNATDVIYSIPAAHLALPQLAARWVVAGHSEGALVAVSVAEAENEIADPNYLGAVALSGVAEMQELFQRFAEGPQHRELVFLAHGIKTIFPAFRVDDMLTEKAIPLYELVSRACEAGLRPELPARDMLKPGWENNSYVRQFFARNTLGQRPIQTPLLVISGDADPDVPSFVTAKVVSRLCQAKDRVVFIKFAALNASGIISESVGEQNSWIRARFLGRPAPCNCP
jgi:pimeloyl-ACP methyl ester carboxylesterase